MDSAERSDASEPEFQTPGSSGSDAEAPEPMDPAFAPGDLPAPPPAPEEAAFERATWLDASAFRAALIRGAAVFAGVAVLFGTLASATDGAAGGLSVLVVAVAFGVLTALAALLEFSLLRSEPRPLALVLRLALGGLGLTVLAIGAGFQSAVNHRVLKGQDAFVPAFEHVLERALEGGGEVSALLFAWIGPALVACVGARVGRFQRRWQVVTIWLVSQSFAVVAYPKNLPAVSILFLPLAALSLPVAAALGERARRGPLRVPGVPKRTLAVLLLVLAALVGLRARSGDAKAPLPVLTEARRTHVWGSSSMCFGAISTDGTRYLTGTYSGGLHLWELDLAAGDASELAEASFEDATGQRVAPRAGALSADGRWAVVGDGDGDLHLFDVRAGELTPVGKTARLGPKGVKPVGRPYKVSAEFDSVASVTVSGSLAVAAYESQRVVAWSVTEQGLTDGALLKGSARFACFSRTGRTLAVGGYLSAPQVYRVESSGGLTPLVLRDATGAPFDPKSSWACFGAAWSGDELLVATDVGVQRIRVDEAGLGDPRVEAPLLGPELRVRNLWISQEEGWLLGTAEFMLPNANGSVTHHREPRVRVWRLETHPDGSLSARFATSFPTSALHVGFDGTTGWAAVTQERNEFHLVDLYGDREVDGGAIRWGGTPTPPTGTPALTASVTPSSSGSSLKQGAALGLAVTVRNTGSAPATWVTATLTTPPDSFEQRVVPPLLLGTLAPGASVTRSFELTTTRTISTPLSFQVEFSDQWGAAPAPVSVTR